MALIDKWADFDSGALTAPVVVQLDRYATGQFLAWVYTTQGLIVGPYPVESWTPEVEASILVLAEESTAPKYNVICDDGTTVLLNG